VYEALARDIKVSIGISGKDLNKEANIKWIVAIHSSSMVEFWHHGQAHGISEYRGANFTSQEKSFYRCFNDFFNKTGIKFSTFGAPYNRDDDATAKLLEGCGDIKAWFSTRSRKKTTKVLLKKRMHIEKHTGEVDKHYFHKHYEDIKNKEGVYSLQIHPKDWKEQHFEYFSGILDFLIGKGWVFKLPRELV